MMDKKIVEGVAHLARIELQPDELGKLSGQLEHILQFIDKLNEVKECSKECPGYRPVEIHICKKHDCEYIDMCPECEREYGIGKYFDGKEYICENCLNGRKVTL